MSKIIEKDSWLSNRHTYFTLANLSMQGGQDYINKYLIQHVREGDVHFEKRKEISSNINLTQKVISIMTSFVVKNISRRIDDTINKDVYQMYIDSIDFENTLNELIEKKIGDYLTQGNTFVFVDSISNDRAYTVDVNYLQILAYQKGINSLNYIDIYHNSEYVARYMPNEIKITTKELYDKDKWLETLPNPLGEIPVVAIKKKIDVKRAYFEDALYISRTLFNQYNAINQQLMDTGFLMLAVPSSSSQVKDIETSPFVVYNPAFPHLPHYIAPDTAHLDFHLKYINHLENQFLSSLNIYREQNTNPQSGLSKSYDFSIMNSQLSNIAQKFEAFEKSIWNMIAKFDTRIKPNKITVEYKRDFDVKSLNEEIENYMNVLSLGISETFNKIISKKIVNRYLADDDSDIQKINAEIDKMNMAITVNDELDNIKKEL